MDYKEHLVKLVESFRKEGMLHWKQMLAVEVASAVLAGVLIQNNVVIDCESESIQWPFGVVSNPPSNTQSKKGKATSKSVKSGKLGTIFGVIVNDIQPEESKKLKLHRQRLGQVLLQKIISKKHQQVKATIHNLWAKLPDPVHLLMLIVVMKLINLKQLMNPVIPHILDLLSDK